MGIDLKKYPKDWKEISKRIRLDRAGNKCEECGAENHKPHPVTGSKVCLTVAHLWRNECTCHPVKCGIESHLKALCNRCHLNYDRPHHIANARRTRQQKKYKDQIKLPFEGK